MAAIEIDDLLESWRVNNAVTLELLRMCPDETMDLKPGKGKTIRSNFTHIVGVRGDWIKDKFPKAAIPKLDWKTASRKEIEKALIESEKQMQDVFKKRLEKPSKNNLMSFFAYLIAHEAHHRSQIEIALRLADSGPDDATWYSWWDWAKK